MSPRKPYGTNTVTDAIAMVLRKELLHLWAIEQPESINVAIADSIVSVVAPPLVDDLVEIANLRFPGLNVGPHSQLPQETIFFASCSSGNDVHLTEHGELIEELQSFLASHDLMPTSCDVRPQLNQIGSKCTPSHPWQRWLSGGCALLLPADAVLGLCAAAAPALLAGGGRRSSVPADDACLDESLYGNDALAAGAPQGLARALRCRRRVFALERELVSREHAEREKEDFDRREQQKKEARIMNVNRQLEEKLKVRTEELRRAGQKIIEAQRNVDDARSQLAEKKREAEQLKYQLDQDTGIRDETHIREKNLTRTILRRAAREALMRERASERADRLQECLKQSSADVADVLRDNEPDEAQSKKLIDQMEDEFTNRIHRRKEQYNDALRDFEKKIDNKRREYNDLCKKLRDAGSSYSRPQWATGAAIPSMSPGGAGNVDPYLG